MRKIIFSGIMAVSMIFALHTNAQERIRSNQIERRYNETEQRVRNDYRNTTDSLQRVYDRTRSNFQHVGDTLRNEYDRNRSNFRNTSDSIRSDYNRTRNEYNNERRNDRMRNDSIRRSNRRML